MRPIPTQGIGKQPVLPAGGRRARASSHPDREWLWKYRCAPLGADDRARGEKVLKIVGRHVIGGSGMTQKSPFTAHTGRATLGFPGCERLGPQRM